MKKKGLLIFLIGIVCTYMTATTPTYLTSPQNQQSISSNQTFRWISNEALKSHELKIYNCNYDAGNNNQSLRLDEYELLLIKDIGRNLQVSGLACGVENQSPLVACNGGIQQLNAYGLSMAQITFNWLAGFPSEAYSGITHLSNGNYVLAESDQNYIYYIPYVSNSGTFIGHIKTPEYKLNLGAGNGIQGITYNPINNKIYVAQEKSPITLHEFSAFSAPNFTGNVSLKVPFDMAKAAENWGIKSVNGLFHLGQDFGLSGTNTAKHMLILSGESNVVIESDMRGNEISRLNLGKSGANGTLSAALEEASGIAYYNGGIYITTKSDIDRGKKAKMYLLQNKNHKNPTARLGSSVFSKAGISGESYTNVPNSTFQNDKTYCWEIIGTDTEGNTTKSATFSFNSGNPNPGCTDPDACNYMADATQDDGSCEYASCAPVITSISSPSAGQKFYPGNTISIKWIDNFSEDVSIRLISVSDNRTVSSSTASDGTFNYIIPTDIKPSSNYRIEIQRRGDRSVIRTSAFFTIAESLFINIYAPSAQSKYNFGDKVNVYWEHNVTGSFNLSLYKGSRFVSTLVNNTTQTGFSYQIPNNLAKGDDYRFRVTSNSTNASDYSSYVAFNEVICTEGCDPYITITDPKQNAIYNLGQQVTIKWVKNFEESIDIFLLKNDRYVQDIAKNVSGNSYIHRFENLDQASDYSIYARSTRNANVSDYGPIFRLLETNIKVNSPVAGNVYDAGDYISIRWEDASSNNVSVKLYDGNTLVSTVKQSILNTGTFGFRAPSVKQSSNYKIVITSLEDNSKSGESGTFTINAQDAITDIFLLNGSFNNNSKYLNNDDFLVTWKDKVSGNVILQLYKDGSWFSGLTGQTKSDGIEKIVLPGKRIPDGSNYQIKILSVRNPGVFNFSESFSIVANNGNRIVQIEDNGILNLYPNPSNGLFSIDVPSSFNENSSLQLNIFNALGRTILSDDFIDYNNVTLDVNLTTQPKGLYFVTISNSFNNYKGKILLD